MYLYVGKIRQIYYKQQQSKKKMTRGPGPPELGKKKRIHAVAILMG